jgi:hypothetical protein
VGVDVSTIRHRGGGYARRGSSGGVPSSAALAVAMRVADRGSGRVPPRSGWVAAGVRRRARAFLAKNLAGRRRARRARDGGGARGRGAQLAAVVVAVAGVRAWSPRYRRFGVTTCPRALRARASCRSIRGGLIQRAACPVCQAHPERVGRALPGCAFVVGRPDPHGPGRFATRIAWLAADRARPLRTAGEHSRDLLELQPRADEGRARGPASGLRREHEERTVPVLTDPVIGALLRAVQLQAGRHPMRSLSPPVGGAQPTWRDRRAIGNVFCGF